MQADCGDAYLGRGESARESHRIRQAPSRYHVEILLLRAEVA